MELIKLNAEQKKEIAKAQYTSSEEFSIAFRAYFKKDKDGKIVKDIKLSTNGMKVFDEPTAVVCGIDEGNMFICPLNEEQAKELDDDLYLTVNKDGSIRKRSKRDKYLLQQNIDAITTLLELDVNFEGTVEFQFVETNDEPVSKESSIGDGVYTFYQTQKLSK